MDSTPGICFDDCCLLFKEEGCKFVPKDPGLNIYVHVPRNLTDPYEEAAMSRVNTYYKQSYWKNKKGLKVQFAGLVIATHGKNVDRCLQTLAAGGVGQSIHTAHINALLK
eukprot:5184945-Karenia_brevis.AAC.1